MHLGDGGGGVDTAVAAGNFTTLAQLLTVVEAAEYFYAHRLHGEATGLVPPWRTAHAVGHHDRETLRHGTPGVFVAAPDAAAVSGISDADVADAPPVAAVLPAFFAGVVCGPDPVRFSFMGLKIVSGSQSLWGYSMSFAALLVAVGAPVFGAAADAGGKRKLFLGVMTSLGVAASALLAFSGPGRVTFTLSMVVQRLEKRMAFE